VRPTKRWWIVAWLVMALLAGGLIAVVIVLSRIAT
jgi:hypothetical protein